MHMIYGQSTITHCRSAGIFLGVLSQNPGVSKSNQLHVDSTGYMSAKKTSVLFIKLEYIMYSSNTIGNFTEALNFNRLFLKLNWFTYNYTRLPK